MVDRMSSNSFAVLGMLALRPWTPYELTQQFLRSLRWCWPVSERLLYTEPERLVAAGLAEVRVLDEGSHTRRQYTITPAGRRALREWLATPPAPPRIFNEPLLRVLYADQGDTADLLNGLASLRAAVGEQLVSGRAHTREYLENRGPFPDRAHLVALFADLNNRLFTAIDEWAEDSIRQISTWPTTRDLGRTAAATELLEGVAGRPIDTDRSE